jgi:ribosomal protein L24
VIRKGDRVEAVTTEYRGRVGTVMSVKSDTRGQMVIVQVRLDTADGSRCERRFVPTSLKRVV